jgi:hypothetical protein
MLVYRLLSIVLAFKKNNYKLFYLNKIHTAYEYNQVLVNKRVLVRIVINVEYIEQAKDQI